MRLERRFLLDITCGSRLILCGPHRNSGNVSRTARSEGNVTMGKRGSFLESKEGTMRECKNGKNRGMRCPSCTAIRSVMFEPCAPSIPANLRWLLQPEWSVIRGLPNRGVFRQRPCSFVFFNTYRATPRPSSLFSNFRGGCRRQRASPSPFALSATPAVDPSAT